MNDKDLNEVAEMVEDNNDAPAGGQEMEEVTKPQDGGGFELKKSLMSTEPSRDLETIEKPFRAEYWQQHAYRATQKITGRDGVPAVVDLIFAMVGFMLQQSQQDTTDEDIDNEAPADIEFEAFEGE